MTTSVLNTPEILEMILIQTDIRTLLTSAQRVCRAWSKLITSSPSIQKALYFAPIKSSEGEPNEKTLNPLLKEKFPPIFPLQDSSTYDGFDFSDFNWTKDILSLTRFVRADASWRKMLIQQPPISEIGLFSLFCAKGGDSAGLSKIPVSYFHSTQLRPDLTYHSAQTANILSHTQAREKNQERNCEGLRMGRLFDILLFSHRIKFETGTTHKVYWAAETPLDLSFSYGNINDEFHKLLARFGVVLWTRHIMQCCTGMDTPLSKSETTRREIIEAYREKGVDVGSKTREIEASRALVEDEKSLRAGPYVDVV